MKSRQSSVREWLTYGSVVAAIWLGANILTAPIIVRAPPNLALRIAPSSPEALRRGAEAALSRGHPEAARELANESLRLGPFNARALRVSGLALDKLGRRPQAAEALTLAGNWSLRDDPAHAWLVEYGLRRGSYGLAFAHADTLARRRTDIHPQIFNLFTTAALADPRALSALVPLMAARPSWRSAYLGFLNARPDGDALLLSLAVGLQSTEAPLEAWELQQIYLAWVSESRFTALAYLRQRLNNPPLRSAVTNGGFETPLESQVLPFGWALVNTAGIGAEFLEDDFARGNKALRAEYDGYATGVPIAQMVLLRPGRYLVTGRSRMEASVQGAGLLWVMTCADSGVEVGRQSLKSTAATSDGWVQFSFRAVVPADCPAQWMRLTTRAAETRSTIITWFDDIKVSPETSTISR